MKRYKTTKKHPVYKENLIVEVNDKDEVYIKTDGGTNLEASYIDDALENGWIEEIQEPEFTKDDLHNLMEFISTESPITPIFASSNYHLRMLKLWLKKRDENNSSR